MSGNPLLWPTLALAFALYALGYRLLARPGARRRWLVPALLLALPALLMAGYYTHLFDGARWFYAFRALPYSELSAAGAGLPAGMCCALARSRRLFELSMLTATLGLLALVLVIPYVKMLTTGVKPARFHDLVVDGVCMQSTPSSCGPASAATLLRAAGVAVTERELAVESYTSLSGTENWYLARALRRRGFRVEYLQMRPSPAALPYPAIAGTRMNGPSGPGHFIAILGREGDAYLVGDPLSGLRRVHPGDRRPYHFTGFFMRVTRRR